MRRLPRLLLCPIAAWALCLASPAQHLPPPIDAGSEREFVERRLAELAECEDPQQAGALVRLAFTAADAVAFRTEFEQAEALFERILEAAEARLDDRTAIGELWCHATRIPMWREEYSVAEEGLRAGLEDLQPGTLYSSIAHNALAICVDHLNRGEEALVLAEAAVRDLDELRSEHPQVYSLASNTKAVILSQLGHEDEALATREELGTFMERHAVRLSGTTGAEIGISQHEGYALLCHVAGRASEMRRSYEKAIALADAQLVHDDLPVALRTRYGGVLVDRGDAERALPVLEESAELFERWREKHVDSEAITSVGSPWRALARARVAAGHADAAFEALDRHHGRLVLDRCSPGSDEIPGLAELRAALEPHEALIGWIYRDGERGHAYVVRREGEVRWFDQPAAADERSRTVITYAASIAGRGAGPLEPLEVADVHGPARDYYAKTFAVLEPALEDVESLFIVSAQGIDAVPLQACIDDRGRFLGERFAMTVVPSGSVHAWLRRRAVPADPPASALLVGDPPFRPKHQLAMENDESLALAEAPGLRRAASSSAPDFLPRLSGTRREVLDLAERFAAPKLLLGQRATADALRTESIAAELVHLATHARFVDQAATRSSLFLACDDSGTPSRVAVTEIGRHWDLRAELVTLSACSTGREWQTRSGIELGFTQAFLAAGARSVLASAWAVDDEVTRLFMDAFYEGWLGEPRLSRARALQAAAETVRSFVDESGARPYAHPYYWAAFSLFGDGR